MAVRRISTAVSIPNELGVLMRIVVPRVADAGALVIVGRGRNTYGGL